MRRFRVDTESAATALGLSEIVWLTCRQRWGCTDRARRASRLLLHWWAVGHDPARHVLRRLDCEHCAGKGQEPTIGGTWVCDDCHGTGIVHGGKL